MKFKSFLVVSLIGRSPGMMGSILIGCSVDLGKYIGAGIIAAFAIILFVLGIVFRKKIQENADITKVRYKKANQVAQRRLKVARRLLDENKKEAFYEEIERAAWTYLSDRLSISTAQLNKENISQILSGKGVNDQLIREVNQVLSTAEFARYAPTTDHAMQDMYNSTTQMINNLESQKL
jgi:hypothetical protein